MIAIECGRRNLRHAGKLRWCAPRNVKRQSSTGVKAHLSFHPFQRSFRYWRGSSPGQPMLPPGSCERKESSARHRIRHFSGRSSFGRSPREDPERSASRRLSARAPRTLLVRTVTAASAVGDDSYDRKYWPPSVRDRGETGCCAASGSADAALRERRELIPNRHGDRNATTAMLHRSLNASMTHCPGLGVARLPAPSAET